MRPSFYECQECSEWDDINGCWRDCRHIGDERCTGDFLSNDDTGYDEEVSD